MSNTDHAHQRETSPNTKTVVYQWYSNFDCLQHNKDMLKQSLLILAGPSGSGKSSIAIALSKIDPTCLILRNYTTRALRLTDYPGHFVCLSEHDFRKAHTEKQFFLARLQPYPRYGYKASDLKETLFNRRYPVLMFRHSGAKYLLESVGAISTVFVEGEPKEIAMHSRNVISPPTEEGVNNTLVKNRQLQEKMAQEHWPFFRVTNHYRGENELLDIAQQIKYFLHTKIDVTAMHQREISLAEPRYGISLVAGRPFPQDIINSLEDVHTRLIHVAQRRFTLHNPTLVHLTILRGKSSPTPCSIVPPPQEVALAIDSVPPVTVSWSGISLDSDGAIRAYAIPRTWPFSSNDRAHKAARALSRIYDSHISMQPLLWATLGMIRTTALQQNTLNKVRDLLSHILLPKITITQLKLLHYHDIYMKKVDTLETYDLR